MQELQREEWYQEWFDEDYLTLYSHRNKEEAKHFVSALWSSLELHKGILIADVPCGPGRHSVALAERGARVVGMDLSPVMLHHAQQTSMLLNLKLEFVRGDLRRIPLGAQFQVVLNLFTSFGYFDDEADNLAAFGGLSKLLVPGGVLVLDTINPHYLRTHFVSENSYSCPAGKVIEHRLLDEPQKRVTKTIELCKENQHRLVTESIRLYDSDDLTRFSHDFDLEPIEFWGDYSGETFTPDSQRLILLARKK